jgi:hypothetical protein
VLRHRLHHLQVGSEDRTHADLLLDPGIELVEQPLVDTPGLVETPGTAMIKRRVR